MIVENFFYKYYSKLFIYLRKDPWSKPEINAFVKVIRGWFHLQFYLLIYSIIWVLILPSDEYNQLLDSTSSCSGKNFYTKFPLNCLSCTYPHLIFICASPNPLQPIIVQLNGVDFGFLFLRFDAFRYQNDLDLKLQWIVYWYVNQTRNTLNPWKFKPFSWQITEIEQFVQCGSKF